MVMALTNINRVNQRMLMAIILDAITIGYGITSSEKSVLGSRELGGVLGRYLQDYSLDRLSARQRNIPCTLP